MLLTGPGPTWASDLPLCFPDRACVDVPPGGAQALYLVSDVTPWSPGIAAVLWAGLGAVTVLLGAESLRHLRGQRFPGMAVLMAVGLVVGGMVLTWITGAWLGEADLVYAGNDGRPQAAPPSTVIGAWPLVRAAGGAATACGTIALLLVLGTAVARRGRSPGSPRPGRPRKQEAASPAPPSTARE